MFRNLAIFFCLVSLASCTCQKSASTDENKDISSEKIKVFLRDKNFEIVNTANLVVAFNIEKNLLEGTTNEYSNKVVLKDTLKNEKAKQLLVLLKNDSSYDWTSKEGQKDFNATQQFLIKNNTKRIFLLLDEEGMKLGFINLDGQKIVKISKNLSNYFKNL